MNKSCARHTFRDHTMKKFFLFSVMALLIGGITITANAQIVKGEQKSPKPQKTTSNQQQANPPQQTDYTQAHAARRINRLLDEYEEFIQDVVRLSNENKLSNADDISYYMSMAYDRKKTLNNLTNEMTSEQKGRFGKLNTRLDRFKSRGKR